MDTTEARPASQILATMASPLAPPTTPRPNPASSAKSKPGAQQRQQWLDKWLRLRITHPQLETVSFEVYDLCRQYVACPAVGKTVVLHGENGCGKTHIAKKVAYWASRIAMLVPFVETPSGTSLASSLFVNWPEVVDGFKRDRWDVLDDLLSTTLLVIDDIGAEHDPSRVGVEKLYVLLNRRERNWNFITTNILPGEWPEKFERRIASRLFRNAQHLDLSKVPDYSTT